MANKNDEKILELKKRIEEKRQKVKVKKHQPLTNMMMEFEGNRYNLNVLNVEKLTEICIKLFTAMKSAEELKLEYSFSGYSIRDWFTDVQAKLDELARREEEKNLALMEKQLSDLLSEEKQTELQIDKIASFLDND